MSELKLHKKRLVRPVFADYFSVSNDYLFLSFQKKVFNRFGNIPPQNKDTEVTSAKNGFFIQPFLKYFVIVLKKVNLAKSFFKNVQKITFLPNIFLVYIDKCEMKNVHPLLIFFFWRQFFTLPLHVCIKQIFPTKETD